MSKKSDKLEDVLGEIVCEICGKIAYLKKSISVAVTVENTFAQMMPITWLYT